MDTAGGYGNGLFMPKKEKSEKTLKRPSELINELNSKDAQQGDQKRIKKAPRNIDEEYHIVKVDTQEDNDRERRKKLCQQRQIRWNTHFQSVSLALFKQNIISISQLASYLYLDATTVIQYCFYWLGEYNNREIASHLLFNDLLRGILYNPPLIEVTGHYGLKYKLDGRSSYCLLLRFIGSDLHRIPHVHFTQRGTSSNPDRENAALLKGFAYITNPLNKCFLSVSGAGMKAELQADGFVYNTVMEEFFEPSFIIMTCILLALNYQGKSFLYNLMVGKKVSRRLVNEIDLEMTQKRIELIQTSLSVLEEYIEAHTEDDVADSRKGEEEGDDEPRRVNRRVKKEEDGIAYVRDCIDINDERGHLKRSRLVYDLVSIVVAIKENVHDLNRMHQCVAQKWLEKSNYCAKQMSLRTQSMIDQL